LTGITATLKKIDGDVILFNVEIEDSSGSIKCVRPKSSTGIDVINV
jgi:hypothetical protein